jgi:hypothetical protein
MALCWRNLLYLPPDGLQEPLVFLPQLGINFEHITVVLANVLQSLLDSSEEIVPAAATAPTIPACFHRLVQTVTIERAVGVFLSGSVNRFGFS